MAPSFHRRKRGVLPPTRKPKTRSLRRISAFFSLPPEIRGEIFHQALVAPAAGKAIRLPANELQTLGNEQAKALLKTTTTLCVVSKQMHTEAHTYFLAHNHLHLHWHGNITTPAWDAFQAHALPHVRTLSLSISDYQICWMVDSRLRRLFLDMRACSNGGRRAPAAAAAAAVVEPARAALGGAQQLWRRRSRRPGVVPLAERGGEQDGGAGLRGRVAADSWPDAFVGRGAVGC
ncbi:unnamed protein product [Discula destructiva]